MNQRSMHWILTAANPIKRGVMKEHGVTSGLTKGSHTSLIRPLDPLLMCRKYKELMNTHKFKKPLAKPRPQLSIGSNALVPEQESTANE